MNHNFANWELTQLLPEINPYSNIDEWVEIEDDDIVYMLESEIEDEDYYGITVRDAWTLEDIRLYLKEKDFIICYSSDTKDCNAFIYRYNFDSDMFLNNKEEIRGNYEEVREKAIVYCLNLINNDIIK